MTPQVSISIRNAQNGFVVEYYQHDDGKTPSVANQNQTFVFETADEVTKKVADLLALVQF